MRAFRATRWVAIALLWTGCRSTSDEPTAAPDESLLTSDEEEEYEDDMPELEKEPPDGFSSVVKDWLGRDSVDYRRESDYVGIALKHRGHVRYFPDGADLGSGDYGTLKDPLRFYVIDDGDWPRIVTNDPNVRMLVYVDVEDAVYQLVSRTALRPTPDPIPDPPPHGLVVLHPGARVEVLEDRDDVLQVEYRRGKKEAHRGWVTIDRLSKTAVGYEQDAVEPRYIVTKRVDISRPGSRKPMVRIPKNAFVNLLDTKGTSPSALIDYRQQCDLDVSYVGYVPRKNVVEADFGRGFSCGAAGSRYVRTWGKNKNAPKTKVAAGQFLLDPERGKVVGCVVQETELADLGDGLLGVASPWGALPVKLSPPRSDKCGAGEPSAG
jgi:hypothetical protein